MAAGSIVVDLLLKTGSFEADSKRAEKNLRELQKQAEEAGRVLGLAFVAAGTAFIALTKHQINSLDAFNDLSDATGASVENLSKLEGVITRNGGSFEDLSAIVVKFNNALKDADGKNAISQVLQNLGLDVAALKKLDPALALQQTAKAFEAFASDGEKARQIQELFGKSVRISAPFLHDLAEAGQLNASVTTEQAKAAEQFNKSLFEFTANSKEATRTLVADFLPAMNDLIKSFIAAKAANNGSLFQGLFGLSTQAKLTKEAGAINSEISTVVENVERLQDRLVKGQGNPEQLTKLIEAGRSRLGELSKSATETAEKLKALADIQDPQKAKAGPEAPKPPVKPVTPVTKAKDDYSALIKSITEKIAADRAELESDGLVNDAHKQAAKIAADLADGLIHLTQAQIENVDSKLKELSVINDANEAKKREIEYLKEAGAENVALIEGIRARRDALLEQAKAEHITLTEFGLSREAIEQLSIARQLDLAVLADAKAAQADEINDDVAKAYREQAAAIRDAAGARQQLLDKQLQLQNDPLIGASQALKDYLEEIKKAGKGTYDVVEHTLKGLEDLTVTALTKGNAKEAARGFVDTIIAEIYRLYIVKPLLASIFGGNGSGGLGGIISAIGGLFGSVDTSGAGTPSTPDARPRGGAAGGTNMVQRDMITLLHKGEAVVPKAYNPAAGGGGLNVKIVNNAGASVRAQPGEDGGLEVVIERAAELGASRGHARVLSEIARGGPAHRVLAGTYGLDRRAPDRK